jgi:predicted AAA+ superfamily ATPase
LAFPWPQGRKHENPFPAWGLEERLAFGSLPGIVAAQKADRADLLKTFVTVHLEEEIQREALLRDWGAFVRFRELAARESGHVLNYAALSQEAGVALTTIKSHYQLLEDMFVGIRIPAYTRSPRKNLLSTPKFLLFDLGVRHAAAGLTPSDARHLLTFLNEHPDQPGQGFVVCRCDRPLQLHERVTAIPWFCL